MSVSAKRLSTVTGVVLLSAAAGFSQAATASEPVLARDSHSYSGDARIRLMAQNRAAQCINGYRITHQVKNNGRLTGGVILKCRA
jgi:hypothetical protein